jgi:hypothetical protein
VLGGGEALVGEFPEGGSGGMEHGVNGS